MLSNAYLLAKFRFDTAENEPAKNLQNFANFPGAHGKELNAQGRRRARGDGPGPLPRREARRRSGRVRGRWTRRVVANFWQIFGKMLLVFCCIGTDFCN